MIGRTISHYKVTAKLGEGGMGVVYKAEDTKLKRPVALKFLRSELLEDPEHKERFLREAQAAAALDHPNICTVYEIDEEDGQTFLSMAYLEGETVKEKIKARPLKLEEALDIAIQTAQGLQAAHEKGVVHRDIKSANLMVTPQGPDKFNVKVMDFGLAQLAERSRLTKTTTMLGTPAYMSPEQAQKSTTGRRTDIWSLGVVIYEMVTGKLPFEREREQAVLYSIVHEEPEPLTAQRVDVPVELDRIVSKAMAKEPDERYQHIEDMLVDLRALRQRLAAQSRPAHAGAGPPADTASASKQSRRIDLYWRRALPWALLAVSLLVLAATYYDRPKGPDGGGTVRRFTILPELAGAGVYSRASRGGLPAAAAISPDGSRIAYFSQESPPRMWLHDLSSGKSRPIDGTGSTAFRNLLFETSLFWSPKGDSVGFFTQSSLKKVNLRDGGVTILHTRGGLDTRYRGGTWSPDGETIVFSADTGGGALLFAVPASGGGCPVTICQA